MDNHRSKTANIRGFYLAHNTLGKRWTVLVGSELVDVQEE